MKKRFNKLNKEFKKIIILALITSMVFSSFVFAVNIEEEKKKKSQMEKDKKIQEQKVKEIQNKLSTNVKELANCESEIRKKEEEIRTLEEKQKNITDEAEKQKEELKKQEKESEEIEEVVKQRLVQIYENDGGESIFSLIASSEGFSDFLSNYELVKEVTRMDANLLNSLNHKKEKIVTLKKELETKNKLIEENKQRHIELKNEQEKIKSQKEEINRSLSADETKQKQILENYNEKIRKTNSLIEAEIARVARAKAMAQQGGGSGGAVGPQKFVGGRFAWPVPSSRYITAGYGSGYAQGYPGYFHTGLDIGASTGTPAVAANDGVVIYAAFSPYGFGNMVMIDHGGGIYTIYGHGSSIPVSLGQRVKRGQHVLNIGSTGNSTGPHLHFEVREGSRHVNPVPYLY